jgi:hypothetical protein
MPSRETASARRQRTRAAPHHYSLHVEIVSPVALQREIGLRRRRKPVAVEPRRCPKVCGSNAQIVGYSHDCAIRGGSKKAEIRGFLSTLRTFEPISRNFLRQAIRDSF